MSDRLAGLVDRIKELEAELQDGLEADVRQARERLRYTVDRGRVRFSREVLARHRSFRVGLARFVARGQLRNLVTAPFVYGMIVPFLLLDLSTCLFQLVCFPLYGIERVRRRDYLAVDRHHLQYLNGIEKLNCFYCSYANGLLAFVREIAGRTEQYWCPIKHALPVRAPHGRYHRFVPYGDPEAYRQDLPKLRDELAALSSRSRASARPHTRPRVP